jgi:hypothetical protein
MRTIAPHMAKRYEDKADDDSRDDPQESDQDPGEYGDDDDEVGDVPCPYCGEPIYEQAELCPHCRSYISREDAPRPLGQHRVPVWIWIGAVLVMAAVATWVVTKI